MLRDIMEGIFTSEVDMEVVRQVGDKSGLAAAVSESGADVVVVGCEEDELAEIGDHLFQKYPRLTVLAVAAGGRRAFLYELQPQTTPLGEISPQLLVDSIRKAARPDRIA